MTVKLPPMPEPETAVGGYGGATIKQQEHMKLMRAYAIQAVLEERERCAAICREHCENAFDVSFKDYEDTYHDGYQDAANDIETAIRAQPEPEA